MADDRVAAWWLITKSNLMTASLKCDYCYQAHDDDGDNCNDVSNDDDYDNHDVDVDSDDNDDKKKKSKEIFFKLDIPISNGNCED